MTRKRFWGLRNALAARLHTWAKENGLPASGISDRAMRPVSGKPLINFSVAKDLGIEASYKAAWNCKAMRDLRKSLGMEV